MVIQFNCMHGATQSLHVSLYVLNFCILFLMLQIYVSSLNRFDSSSRENNRKNSLHVYRSWPSRKKPQKERNPITLETGSEEPDDPQQGGKNKGIRRILTANADGHVTFETTRLLIQNAPKKKNCIDCTQVLRTPGGGLGLSCERDFLDIFHAHNTVVLSVSVQSALGSITHLYFEISRFFFQKFREKLTRVVILGNFSFLT